MNILLNRPSTHAGRHRRPARRIPPVIREKPLRRYVEASTVSVLGDGISSLAIPLAAATLLHADAAQLGYLSALAWLPSLLFSLHAGAWADRAGHPQRIMIAADLARFAVLASIPAGAAAGVLSLAQLYGVVLVAGTLSAFFNVSTIALFATLVPESQYVAGQSLSSGGQAVASLAGPALGGLLVQALTAPLAVLGDALSFLCSAAFLAGARPRPDGARPAVRAAAGARGSPAAALRFLWHAPELRTALAVTTTSNLFAFMFGVPVLLYLIRGLHMPAGYIGIEFSAPAIGAIGGTMIAGRLIRRMGMGRSIKAASILLTWPLLSIALASGPLLLTATVIFSAYLISGFGRSVQDVAIGSTFAMIVPPGMRSQVRGAYQAISFGARPAGAILGGTLTAMIGLRPTLIIAAAGASLAFLWVVRSSLMTFQLPATPGT